MSSVPIELVDILRRLEPDFDFEGPLPKVRSSSGKSYFAKIGSTSEEEQYVGETRSLQEIDKAAPGLAPKVVSAGNLENGKPYMITEYKEIGHLTDKGAAMLGKRLATELHAYKSPDGKFGFDVPTFCGATKQPNGWYESWDQCFSVLLGNLLKRLEGKSQYRDLCRKGEEIRSRIIPKLLGELEVQPVLLHGDLWSGNIGLDHDTKEPFIFDPSSYFGHNEADLAIGRMFGGIPQSFFDTYHQHFPKANPVEQYASRCDLYELYHYLNHTVLFGGGYAGSALRKMDKLLASW
ncbi:hypothetical protein M378DRAFT_65094 [Amanita muscaria Koide BX008]|uniref:protein-ribulosamine 3-kinase n=1 Tax=Amanita muscaria (strain Koide BX008) TaxID=946122 RepID=A0A0C2XPZ0_AMAMK|nr:hypothetical protein M378DRAFT_65094 [Amanita muscaria Koide BX008]